MNPNPNANVVLCFGDSNTRGTTPTGGKRYPANIRWTGQLQQILGSDYYVIEEGLGGRTTNLNDPHEEKPGRDGLAYFKPCLYSHAPVDIVIIMLGTNDFKNVYERAAPDVAEVLSQYCQFVKQFDDKIQVLLVAPAALKAVEPFELYDERSESRSKELATEIKRLADKEATRFYDAADVVQVGGDGLHWTEESDARFADKVSDIVRQFS